MAKRKNLNNVRAKPVHMGSGLQHQAGAGPPRGSACPYGGGGTQCKGLLSHATNGERVGDYHHKFEGGKVVPAVVMPPYRADWEPEAPSGKCMAGVPGVFWRSPAVLWGPTTHNPTWV